MKATKSLFDSQLCNCRSIFGKKCILILILNPTHVRQDDGNDNRTPILVQLCATNPSTPPMYILMFILWLNGGPWHTWETLGSSHTYFVHWSVLSEIKKSYHWHNKGPRPGTDDEASKAPDSGCVRCSWLQTKNSGCTVHEELWPSGRLICELSMGWESRGKTSYTSESWMNEVETVYLHLNILICIPLWDTPACLVSSDLKMQYFPVK